jgi:hypothetical protein
MAALIHKLFRRLGKVLVRRLAAAGWIELHRGGECYWLARVGPLCIKRWHRTARHVSHRCRISRVFPQFAARWYIPLLHVSIGVWQDGPPASDEQVNEIRAIHGWAADLAPQNVVATRRGPRVIDFGIRSRALGI